MNPNTHYAPRQYTANLSGTLLSLSMFDPDAQKPRTTPTKSTESTESTAPKKRQIITKFTDSSRRRLVKYCREIPKERYKVLVTLTYPTAPNPIESKQHLDRMLELLRSAAAPLPSRPNAPPSVSKQSADLTGGLNGGACRPRAAACSNELEAKSKSKAKAKRTRSRATVRPFSALWIMEYQERGVVHYHIWSSHWFPKAELQRLWNQIINTPQSTPSTRIDGWKAHSKSGLASYVSKYARKESQKVLPPELAETGAGRWWGKIGDTSTPHAIKKRITELDFKELLTLAKSKQWREIPFEYCHLYVVPENDRMSLFTRIQVMANTKINQHILARGRVIHIIDGDTVSMRLDNGKRYKVRLANIDAPELAQDYGTESREALKNLLGSKSVRLLIDSANAFDKYGRLIAELHTAQHNVNLELVRIGAAWCYGRYCSDLEYLNAENEARDIRSGLW
ncbi:MAG: thermonuclease family protein, partial [Pseudanabaena sp. ELA748]